MSTTPTPTLPGAPTTGVPIAKALAVTPPAIVRASGGTPDWKATRAAITAATGSQPGPYDSTQPVQLFNWSGANPTACFDPSNASNGFITMETLLALMNVPGDFVYSAYVAVQTEATWSLPGSPALSIVPIYLASQADAQKVGDAIMEQIIDFGVSGRTAAYDTNDLLPNVEWNGETRRFWELTVKNSDNSVFAGPFNLGLMIAAQNSEGVGYPGSFIWNKPSLNWVAQVPNNNPPAGYKTALTPLLPIAPGYYIGAFIPNPLMPTPVYYLLPGPPPANQGLAAQIMAIENQMAVEAQELAQLEAALANGAQ